MSRDLIVITVILAAWIILNKWILPALGIPTCMSGGCSGTPTCTISDQSTAPESDQTESDTSSKVKGTVAPES